MSDWYDITKNLIGTAGLDLNNLSNPKIIAIKQGGGYTFSQADDFLSDVGAGARLATTTLSNVTFGVSQDASLDSDDVVFTTPPVGTVDSFVIYNDSGVEATSPLIAFLDDGVGLPILTEVGRDLNVQVAASGLGKL